MSTENLSWRASVALDRSMLDGAQAVARSPAMTSAAMALRVVSPPLTGRMQSSYQQHR